MNTIRSALCCLLMWFGTVATAADHPTDTNAAGYSWHNVALGGGGFSPNIIFSRAESGLAYLRTDIGGLYRWQARQQTWTPLQDAMSEANYFGVESVAADPGDADVVYAAVGMYRAFASAILRSTDRGDHWQITPVTFRMGGNEPGRGVGERLAIDPHQPNILYFGSRFDGLQRSTDSGRTWHKVSSFPYAGLPADVGAQHGNSRTGLSFVVFDPRSGASGAATRTLIVGVADPDPGIQHLYRSDDAGATWRAVDHQPSADLLPVKAEINRNGILYLTYSNGTGPNGVTAGAVYKLALHDEQWTDITPLRNAASGGYMGISVDAQDDDTVMVATLNRWQPGDSLFRSTDAGNTWINVSDHSQRDITATPFLSWGESQVPFGWWMAGLAIDPFDSAHVAYTTGATVYATNEMNQLIGARSIRWQPWVRGVEETAIITLTSSPAGPALYSGFGDIGGFAHHDLQTSPPMFSPPAFDNTNMIEFAGAAPNVLVRSGVPHHLDPDTDINQTTSLAWSNDFGKTWQPINAPERIDGNNSFAIAISADGARLLIVASQALITTDRGNTWQAVSGLPKHIRRVVADRIDARRFYAFDFDHNQIWLSEDGGFHFSAVTTDGLPDSKDAQPRSIEAQWPLIARYDRAGELWLLLQGKLFRSQDSGRHFTQVSNELSITALSQGKAAPGRNQPTLFAIGVRAGVRAIWRSVDAGKRWQRINDAQHEYGRRFRCIAGDPRVFGRVYVGTDGRGIVYGQPAD